jgi:hypothetical protein
MQQVMNLSNARRLLIKKYKAKTLAMFQANQNILNDKNSLECKVYLELTRRYEKLRFKNARQQKPLWSSELDAIPKKHSPSIIWVTRQAYAIIKNQPNNSKVKDAIDKAINFSIYGSFEGKESNILLGKSVCGCTDYSNHVLRIAVEWADGNPDNHVILLQAQTDLDNYYHTFKFPHRLQTLFRRCLPLSAG